ncbi:MAG: hypothetical protein RR744_11265 [Cellulosilyticaceae bacterium]
MNIKQPDYFERCTFYSEDACIEICNDAEYLYEDAVLFVESLGYTVKDGGYMGYDEMFRDWRGFVNVIIK